MNPSSAKIVLSDDLLSARKVKAISSKIHIGALVIDETLYNNYLPALLFPLD